MRGCKYQIYYINNDSKTLINVLIYRDNNLKINKESSIANYLFTIKD